MPEYDVEYEDVVIRTVRVEADSEIEAHDLAYAGDGFLLDEWTTGFRTITGIGEAP